jgi:serine/threonine protein kinase
MAQKWIPRPEDIGQIHYDTTEFFKVDYGDVAILGDKPFLVRHNAKEGRFGLDDEEKYWVKRCIDLTDGSLKIVKLVFFEKFQATIANLSFDCFRSPKKEARILDLVAGHENFMQGYWVKDGAGNIVRIIDYIYGKTLHAFIQELSIDHEAYYHEIFPEIFKNFMECVHAVEFLHHHRQKHGDIRRDHILIDRESGRYRWIDFDFNYMHRENMFGYDLFGLGNILIYIAGMGDVLLADLQKNKPAVLDSLEEKDLNIVFHNRVANLKKVYPYLPESLNRVLRHFSMGAEIFYENTTQLLNDMNEICDAL